MRCVNHMVQTLTDLAGCLMKNFTFLIAITIVSSLALAGTQVDYSRFPKNILCTSEALSTVVQKFEINNLNTSEPNGFEDASFMRFDIEKDDVVLSFSNECDNNYGISFNMIDLKALKEGKLEQVTGVISYSDARSSDVDSVDGIATETVLVVCVLKN